MNTLPIGAGVALIGLELLLNGVMPHNISTALGVLSILMGLMMTVRRLMFNCWLLLDKDGLILPTSFLRVRAVRIPYGSIERVWQTNLPFMAVLCLATKDGKFEVVSGMLPDAASYIPVRDFLNAHAQCNQKSEVPHSLEKRDSAPPPAGPPT